MPVKRMTISMPAELAERIHELAEQDAMPVSQWMTEAAERKARDASARELLRLYEDEFGPITEEERREARAKWPD